MKLIVAFYALTMPIIAAASLLLLLRAETPWRKNSGLRHFPMLFVGGLYTLEPAKGSKTLSK